MSSSILLTGATGFVGSFLMNELIQSGVGQITGICRTLPKDANEHLLAVGGIEKADFSSALQGKDVVIHAAARAHIMQDEIADPLAEYRKVNVEGTLNLARRALAAGVKRFIYISSIGVHGINSVKPFTEKDVTHSHDAYTQSKLESEEALKNLCSGSDMELVIIRPPLVYGGKAPGNFQSLARLSLKKIPLPFGCVNNKRSMIYVGNLVSFIIKCIDAPEAANQTFLVSDAEDVSLRQLIGHIRKANNQPAWLLPVPVFLFKLAGKLTGKSAVVDRLIGDLQVDSSKARQLLNWQPPYSLEQGVAITVQELLKGN